MVGGVETSDLEYARGWISRRTCDIGGSGCVMSCAGKLLPTSIITYGWMGTSGRPVAMVSES
jgi:hypothetical protein